VEVLHDDRRLVAFMRATVEDGDVVTARNQLAHEGDAGGPGPADDENTLGHAGMLAQSRRSHLERHRIAFEHRAVHGAVLEPSVADQPVKFG
jgi:hypothetical protein